MIISSYTESQLTIRKARSVQSVGPYGGGCTMEGVGHMVDVALPVQWRWSCLYDGGVVVVRQESVRYIAYLFSLIFINLC